MYVSDRLERHAPEPVPPHFTRQELRTTARRTFRAREQIMDGAAPVPGALWVLSGILCRYTLTPDGRRQFTALLLPGDLIGFESILNLRCADHALALSGSVCQPVTAADLSRSDIRQRVWETLERQTLAASDWTLNIGMRPGLQRLAYFLYETSMRMRELGMGEGIRYPLPLTQVELADFLALTPVHVNRCLASLRNSGVATFRGGTVEIPSSAALRRVAHSEAELRT